MQHDMHWLLNCSKEWGTGARVSPPKAEPSPLEGVEAEAGAAGYVYCALHGSNFCEEMA
jgi:hypothetical protein